MPELSRLGGATFKYVLIHARERDCRVSTLKATETYAIILGSGLGGYGGMFAVDQKALLVCVDCDHCAVDDRSLQNHFRQRIL